MRTDPPEGVETAPAFVVTGGVYYPVLEGDWVLSSRYNGQVLEVISDEEFTERFGGGGPNVEGCTLAAAAGRLPLWIAVLFLVIAHLVALVPLR